MIRLALGVLFTLGATLGAQSNDTLERTRVVAGGEPEQQRDTTRAPSIATRAELPRSVPNPQFAKATRTRIVGPSDNLQRAINAAQPGDSLLLTAGATWTGNFELPKRSCGAGVTITTAGVIPSGRMTPRKAAGLKLAKIVSRNSVAALKTLNPTCGWRLVGLEIAYNGPMTLENYGALWLGDGGYAGGGENQVSLAQVPQDIVLDRLYIHGAPTLSLRRCLYVNSGRTIVRDSWLSDCHSNGGDSQALLGCNGPGPYLIENNFLEGGHENILFGGCDPRDSTLTPSDITIRRNHVSKPLGWRTSTPKWTVKNLFELKNARRVLVEDNIFENVWPDGQEGMAIVIKSATATCQTCFYEGSTDVTFRYNIVRTAMIGLNLQAIDMSPGQINTKRHVARVTVEHNLFTDIGTANGIAPTRSALMLLTHDLSDILISHNTFVGNTEGSGQCVYFAYSNKAASRIDFQDNICAGRHGSASDSWALGGDGGYHIAALNGFAGTSWSFQRNVLARVSGQYLSQYPPTTRTVDDWAKIRMTPNHSLGPSSPFKLKGYRSTDPGADVAELTRRTAGVVTPP